MYAIRSYYANMKQKTNKSKKILRLFFVFLMVFTLAFAPTGGSSIKKAQAGLPVADWLNFGSGIFNWITNMWSQISQYASQALQAKSWYAEVYEKCMLPIV